MDNYRKLKLASLGVVILLVATLFLIRGFSQEPIHDTYYLNESAVKDYLNTLCNGKIIDIDINNLGNLITTSEPLTSAERNALKEACRENGVAWVDFLTKK